MENPARLLVQQDLYPVPLRQVSPISMEFVRVQNNRILSMIVYIGAMLKDFYHPLVYTRPLSITNPAF